MSTHLTLRPVTDRDSELLLRIYASTRELELARVPWSDAEKHAFVRFQFEAQRKHYYTYYYGAEYAIIEAGGEPAGRLYVHRRSDETRIVDITVLPAFRNVGIGTTLLTRLMAEARAAATSLTIHVEQDNPARRLYDRLGFRQLDHRGLYILMEWRANTVS